MTTYAPHPNRTSKARSSHLGVSDREPVESRDATGKGSPLQQAIGNQATQQLLRSDARNAQDMEGPAVGVGADLTDQELLVEAPPFGMPLQYTPPWTPPMAAGPAVALPPRIRAASSPAGMPDRIPPRVDTPAVVQITGLTIPMRDITLSIEGSGAANGSATINGAATADLGASATVQLRGVTQTAVGSAGQLRLVADHGGTRLAASAGFSVSAIPQNWSVNLNALVTGPERGIDVDNHWESDSGSVADLDQAQRSEQVQYGVGTGCFAGIRGQNSGYRAANNPPLVDHHAAGVGLLTGIGTLTAQQTFIFKDDRTGATDIPAKRSGFSLHREVVAVPAGGFEITTTKSGAGGTANGFTSAAGAGNATSGPQPV